MNTHRQNDQKKFLNSNLTHNPDNSMVSSKSKNSFKDLNEYRNHTPQNKTGHQNQYSASKIKLILSNLVQTDQISSKSQFGQSLREKQDIKQTDNISKNTQQKVSKTPKTKDSYFKQQIFAPSSTREFNHNNENFQNLYYMFQNKQQDSQSQQNVLSLSQLAKKQRSIIDKTPQKNSLNNNQNRDNSQSSIQTSQIQQFKQKIDISLQRKTSQKTEKYQFQNESQIGKTNGINTNQKKNYQDLNSFNKREEISEQLIQLILQKEQIWNQIKQNLEKINQPSLQNHCSELHQILSQLSERTNSQYLYDIEINIIDTFLLESFAVLIILMEWSKGEQILDQNLKNLIIYITSIFAEIKNRIKIILIKKIKQQSQINIIKKQFYHKIYFRIDVRIDDTTYSDIYSSLELKQQSFDLYFVQQNKILNQITKQLQKENSLKSSNISKSVNVVDKKKQPILPSKSTKTYTLVLDLDETLVHYQEFPNGGGQFLVRPYTEEFLEKLSKYYEIIIFTAAQPDYANFIIDIIDKQQVVKARLYREHTKARDNVYVKDLSIIGRDLNKVIIVDNMPENFQLQPENGVYIQSWTGEQKDRALKDLMPLLEQIAIKKCKDVREALNQFREQMIDKVQQGIKNPYQNLQLA
ncbi:unnamed protein product [Paramecium sonneborni]|uniref:FCP1 homology domain-containing protein n=1 Tax=Paramecium sonneborni TaxID=65129 RepID=A0A8S1M9S2_9CILI|nr:unnamed protein product [Paramecium sonneborni]